VDAVAALTRRIMEGVVALRVPLEVDVATGPNWAECKA
jgi:DNA polymerase I-like protein with 3'-5' exonuclease and polymerase domains